MRLLIVEDDPVIAGQIGRGLGLLGHQTALADCGNAALGKIADQPFDAVVLDRMLPDMSGMEVLARVRQRQTYSPVLILSALGSVQDRIEGLAAGADDYLIKPFDLEELSARLHAIVRRPNALRDMANLTVGQLMLNPTSHRASIAGETIDLNRKLFSLLAHLMRNADRVVTRSMLLEHVWGYSFEPTTNIVESNMSRLRGKLQALDRDPIETLRGAGYILRSDRCR